MKNSDNNTNNTNTKLGQSAPHDQATHAKHDKTASGELNLTHLAQLQIEHQDNHNQNQTIPAGMILAAAGDDLPVPLVTQQGQGAADNPPAEAQGQEAAGAAEGEQGAEQGQPQNIPEGKVLGEETLLSAQDVQSADGAAFNPSADEGDATIIQNDSGNVDDVNDTRYDWDRGAPQEEFKKSFETDDTPEVITTVNPVPIANDDYIGFVIRGSCCEREGNYESVTFSIQTEGYNEGCCGTTYNELVWNILPNDVFSSDDPNIISSITVILGGIPQTFTPAQFNGTEYHLDDGSYFTLLTDGTVHYFGPCETNPCELPGAPEIVKIFDYILSDNTPDSDPASVFVKIYEPPIIQIGDACVVETEKGSENNNQLAFSVTLYGELPPGFILKVPYHSYDGSANAGADYEGVCGELTFTGVEGQTEQTATIYVDVLADCFDECSENMYINLDTSCTIINQSSWLNDTSGTGVIWDPAEKIPEQTICSNYVNGYTQLFHVFEAGLPDGTDAGNQNLHLSGNIFYDFNMGSYTPGQIDITDLSLLGQFFTLDNTTDTGNWVLTGGDQYHFIFHLDTEGTGKGDWTFDLDGNAYNQPNGDGTNANFIDLINITLLPQPASCDCSCNYEASGRFEGPALFSETNGYGNNYDGCDCVPIPSSTDMTLKIKVVDDAQIAKDDCVDVQIPCNDVCHENNETQVTALNVSPITGNVLTNDTPSADRIDISDPNSSNFMKVYSINFGSGDLVLNPDVDNGFTTNEGGYLVIHQDGSFEYTPPDSAWSENDVIHYTSLDSDGSQKSADLIFKPIEEECNDIPIAVDDCKKCEVEDSIPSEWSIVINFLGTNAGYNNSFGYYIKDVNGFPTEGQIIWEGVKDNVANGEFVLDQNSLPGVNPCDIGYFIIPDGYTKNKNIISDGEKITFSKDDNDNWQAFKESDNTPLTGKDANIFFDNGNLNIDNYIHVNNVGEGNFNWEDLKNGGDADFNDVEVNIVNNFDCPACSETNTLLFGNLLDNDDLSTDGGNRVYIVKFNGEEFNVPENGLLQLTQDDVTNPPFDFVLLVNSNGNFTFNPGLNDSEGTEHIEFEYNIIDINDDVSNWAEFCFDVLPQIETECEECYEEQGFNSLALFNSFEALSVEAIDDDNSVSEINLLSGSNPDAALLSVTGNILGNDSFDTSSPIEIVDIAGNAVTAADLLVGFILVSTAHGELKMFLADGNGHAQGDYVYTLMSASSNASDSISYSILSNNQLSSANIIIQITDDVPSAESHSFTVSEQPLISGQSDGIVVSTGNVLDGAKSGADVMPVSYAPKVAVDMISFEVLNLSNANQTAYLALGAVITALAGNISKVALAVPLNGDVTFGLPDESEMTIGSNGDYSFAQPANGISADKAYAFTYQITDNDGSQSEADLNIAVKNFNAPIANQDNIWSFDSGTSKINVLDNDALGGSVTVKEISYKDANNLTQTISVPTSGNGSNAFTAAFTTHSGAVVKIDRNGNLEYTAGAKANGQSDIDTLTYKIVETSDNTHFSTGEIKAHIYDVNADFHNLIGNNGPNILDASDLSGTVSMTGAGGTNEFKIDLSSPSAGNPNPSEIAINDLFKIGANNTLTFTGVSDLDGVSGVGIGDVISSINTVSQVTPNGDIHVNFNNGTNLSIQDPGFTMSMPTANEFMNQLQEHSIQVSAQG
jgi:hypothetical protein